MCNQLPNTQSWSEQIMGSSDHRIDHTQIKPGNELSGGGGGGGTCAILHYSELHNLKGQFGPELTQFQKKE